MKLEQQRNKMKRRKRKEQNAVIFKSSICIVLLSLLFRFIQRSSVERVCVCVTSGRLGCCHGSRLWPSRAMHRMQCTVNYPYLHLSTIEKSKTIMATWIHLFCAHTQSRSKPFILLYVEEMNRLYLSHDLWILHSICDGANGRHLTQWSLSFFILKSLGAWAMCVCGHHYCDYGWLSANQPFQRICSNEAINDKVNTNEQHNHYYILSVVAVVASWIPWIRN